MNITVTGIFALFGAISTLLSIVIAITSIRKGQKNEGAATGTLISDVGYIKAGIEDIKCEQRESNDKIAKLTERVTLCEASTKSAHKRLDDHVNKE